MLILYFIPFMAVAALVVEGWVEAPARERRSHLRQYSTPQKRPKRRGIFRR